ncbi:MAG: hypothetical protein IKX43_07605 [Paludibacteraceae bacterium]|nr:hypothetical protein [Paludibacteraceae bacterium]
MLGKEKRTYMRRKALGRNIAIATLSIIGLVSATLFTSCDETDEAIEFDSYKSENASIKEMGERYVLHQNIIDYLYYHNISTESDSVTLNLYRFHFTVTSDGEIKDITFDTDNSPYVAEITTLLESIPHEELNTLTEDWIFHISYVKQGESQGNRLYFISE